MSRFFSSTSHQGTPDYLLSRQNLYERRPVTELWNKLTQATLAQWKYYKVANKASTEWLFHTKRIFWVYGPPGTGKSSAAWEWMDRVCRESHLPLTWIDCAAPKASATRSWQLRFDTGSQQVLVDVSIGEPIVDTTNATVFVFDGIRNSTVEDWAPLMEELARVGVAVIVISSESGRIHQGNTNDIAVVYHRVPSWDKVEYHAACASDDFWQNVPTRSATDVDRRQFIDEKFSVAGHSARFMFRKHVEQIKREMERDAQSIANVNSLQQALTRSGNQGAVNTVIAWVSANGVTPNTPAVIPNFANVAIPASADEITITGELFQLVGTRKNCFVSEFARRTVLGGIDTDSQTLRSIGHRLELQTLVGYALELRFWELLNSGFQSQEQSIKVMGPEIWDVLGLHETDNVLEAIRLHHASIGHWIWAGKMTTAFDAVHFYAPNRIRLVQATAGGDHDFLLYFLVHLFEQLFFRDNITFTHVDFVTLRPLDDSRSFSYKTAVGRLGQGWLDMDGNAWDTRDPRNSTREVKITWS